MREQRVEIESDSGITPFWRRLPRFFLFPFHTGPLLYTALLAASSLLGLFVPLVPDAFGILIVEAGVWLAALRYAFRVLEQTALGFLTPDQYEETADPERVNLPYKMFGITLVWGVITGLVDSVSQTLGMIVNLFTTLAMPASVMALAATNSFAQGINPALWFSIMRTIGKPYLALWIFLFLLLGGGFTGLSIVAPLLNGWLMLPAANFVFIYFNLVMFNLMGYCLYQYHRPLGLDVRVDFGDARDGRSTGTTAKPGDPAGDAIARLIADGDMQGALDVAYEQQRVEQDNVTAQERYYKLLLLLPEKREAALAHGQRLVGLMLKKGMPERALDVFTTCRGLQENFAPGEPGQILLLAQAARRRREFKLSLALMHGFDKRHPRHADVPSVYWLSAQILAENFRKDELASLILQGLLQKFPEHPLAAEAGNYLKALERMAGLAKA